MSNHAKYFDFEIGSWVSWMESIWILTTWQKLLGILEQSALPWLMAMKVFWPLTGRTKGGGHIWMASIHHPTRPLGHCAQQIKFRIKLPSRTLRFCQLNVQEQIAKFKKKWYKKQLGCCSSFQCSFSMNHLTLMSQPCYSSWALWSVRVSTALIESKEYWCRLRW